MPKRYLVLGSLALGVLVVVARLASAASGGGTDPDDASGKIDIRAFGHSDDATDVTFFFETFETFDNDTDFFLHTAAWEIDIDGDGVTKEAGDTCISLVQDGEGGLQAQINDCSSEAGSTAKATFPSPTVGAKRVEFKFPLEAFRTETGINTATLYKYLITVRRSSTVLDTVPDTGLVTHSFGTGPTPSPTPTPTPSPTPQGSATPTPTPTASGATPTPSPTPSPGPNDTSATGTPSKSSVTPGESVSLSATTGFKANASLTAVMNSTPVTLASITANATGGFSAAVSIPSTATAGSHTIVVSGANNATGIHSVTFPITVASATGSSLSATSNGGGGPTLPNTGMSIFALVIVAGALLLVGIELIGKKERMQGREDPH